MIHAIYLIKNGRCIFNFKRGPSSVSNDVMSGFLDAVAQLSQIIGKMKLINLQDHRLIYTPLNESTFMATLIDGDEPKEFIDQFLEKNEELLHPYEDVLKLKDLRNSDLYKSLEPKFTKLLLNLPCAYLKKEFMVFKCLIDDKRIDNEHREAYCNSYNVVECDRVHSR